MYWCNVGALVMYTLHEMIRSGLCQGEILLGWWTIEVRVKARSYDNFHVNTVWWTEESPLSCLHLFMPLLVPTLFAIVIAASWLLPNPLAFSMINNSTHSHRLGLHCISCYDAGGSCSRINKFYYTDSSPNSHQNSTRIMENTEVSTKL